MKIKKDLILRRIGNENIIIVPDRYIVDMTEVFSLNETSAWIWEQIQNREFSIEDIVELVEEHYEVGREEAMKDVQFFINFLRKKELIVDN